jgi:hypothetical protein
MQNLIKKISPNTITADRLQRLDLAGAPTEVILYDLYGIVHGIRKGTTDKGEWTQFRGQFEAQTLEGEIFGSGACFVPQPFEDMLYSQVMSAKEADPNASVQFACRVSIVPPAKGKVSATGYEYRVKPLIDNPSSPLDGVRQLVSGVRSRLLALANSQPTTDAS